MTPDAPSKLPPEPQAATYRADRYYINRDLGHGMRREEVVPAWRFYLTWLLTFWRIERRWEHWSQYHVLRERERR